MPIDKVDLWKKASRIRNQLGEDNSSPIDVLALVQSIEKLTVVFYNMGKNLSGMCIKGNENNVIAVNSSMSLGRQRFSLSHELFHLYFDASVSTTICSTKIGSGNDLEKQADIFASFFLMPPDALSEKIRNIKKSESDKLVINDIIRLEQYFGVSRQAMLIRLVEEKELSSSEIEPMKKNVIWSAASSGYDDSLYKPLPENKQFVTYGFYIQKTEELYAKGLISSGKYEELLLDAFRSDLVYGDNEGGEFID